MYCLKYSLSLGFIFFFICFWLKFILLLTHSCPFLGIGLGLICGDLEVDLEFDLGLDLLGCELGLDLSREVFATCAYVFLMLCCGVLFLLFFMLFLFLNMSLPYFYS